MSQETGIIPVGDRAMEIAQADSAQGGRAPKSGPCDPFSAHGYFGKESETVEEIVNWMMKKPFRQEVR